MNERVTPAWLSGLPAVLGVALFARTVSFEFVAWDDNLYILENARVLDASLQGLLQLWNPAHAYRGEFIEYFPLRDSIYWALHALFGTTAGPFHLVNAVLHGAVCACVGPFLSRLGVPRLGALFGALVFAAHPVHVESIAWVSGMKDPLYTLFALGVFWRWMAGDSKTHLAQAGAFLLGGLLVKAMIVVVPVQLFLLDVILRRRPLKATAIRVAPLLAISLLFTLHFMAIGKANGVLLPLKGGTLLSNTLTGLWSLTSYVSYLILPLDLNARYVVPPVTELLSLRGVTALAVTAIFVSTVVVLARPRPRLSFGIAFYLAGLSTVLGFVPFNIEIADRYQYEASLGYVFLLGGGLAAWAAKGSRVPLVAGGLVVVMMSVGTVNRSSVWQSSLTLWEDMLDQPMGAHMTRMRMSYALALIEAGRIEEGVEQLRLQANSPLGLVQAMRARNLLARMALANGRVVEARELLEPYRHPRVHPQVATDLAWIAVHEGDLVGAKALLNAADSSNDPGRDLLVAAAVALAEGNEMLAQQQVTRAVALRRENCQPGEWNSAPRALHASMESLVAEACEPAP